MTEVMDVGWGVSAIVSIGSNLFTWVGLKIVVMLSFWITMLIGLSDNYFSCKTTGNLPWREYYRKIEGGRNPDGITSSWDEDFHKVKAVLRRDFIVWLAYRKRAASFSGEELDGMNMMFSFYILKLDLFLALYVAFYFCSGRPWDFAGVPFVVFIVVLLWLVFRNIYLSHRQYFNLHVVHCDSLYVYSKKFMRSTERYSVDINDISRIKIYPLILAYPYRLFDLHLILIDGTSVRLKGCSEIDRDISSLVAINDTISLSVDRIYSGCLYKGLFEQLRTSLADSGIKFS